MFTQAVTIAILSYVFHTSRYCRASDVDVAANIEVNSSHLPAFVHSPPHHLERRDVFLHRDYCAACKRRAASTIPPRWRCISRGQPMNDESGWFHVGTKWLFYLIPTMHNVLRHFHRRSCPIVSLAERKKHGNCAANSVRVVCRPTTHNTSHHFHKRGQSCKRATVQTAPGLVFVLSCVTRLLHLCLQHININVWRKDLESLTVHHPSRPDRDRGQLRQNGRAASGRAVHRNSNPRRHPPDANASSCGWAVSISNITNSTQEDRLSLVPWSFIRGNCQRAPARGTLLP